MLTPRDLQSSIQVLCESSRRTTRDIPARRSSATGSELSPQLLSDLGHGDATLRLCVSKSGSTTLIWQEDLHLRELGESVCPVPLGVIPADGWSTLVLPFLAHHPWRWSLCRAVEMLQRLVWVRPALAEWVDDGWEQEFEERFRMHVPEDVLMERFCLVHGDPTLANIRHRAGHIRLIDTKWPGRGIPPMRSVDLGKILQSMMGWELALLSSRGHTDASAFWADQEWPLGEVDDREMRRVVFWCMVHFLRIHQREGDTDLGLWAQRAALSLEEYSA